VHAYGAAFDNPDLVVACVVGDGEAETGPLAASWASTRFVNPGTDGAVLPILHLNGYKIANPAVLARVPASVHGSVDAAYRESLVRRFALPRERPRALLLVPLHVHVLVAGAPVREPVDQPD
jgi:hypothetical protein